MALLIDPEKRAQIRERLRKLIHVNVGFDDEGSKIVVYRPDTTRIRRIKITLTKKTV